MPRKYHLHLANAFLKLSKFICEFLRQMSAETSIVLIDSLKLKFPLSLVDVEDLLEVFGRDLEAFSIERALLGKETNWGGNGGVLAIATAEDPSKDTAVVTIAWPEVLAVILSEPVDHEDLGKVGTRVLADINPVLEVVTHVIPAEWEHGEWVTTDASLEIKSGSSNLRAYDGAIEDTSDPAVSLIDKWDGSGATAAEEDSTDWDTCRVLPLRGNARALASRGRETRVGVGNRLVAGWVILDTLPIDGTLGARSVHALPPDITVGSETDVGEDGVLLATVHGIGVGLEVGARGDTEEASFGVDGMEIAVLTELHPSDIVANSLNLPARKSGDKHG